MSQWQPQQDPRRPAAPPQWGQQPSPQDPWAASQPQYQQPYQPQGYGQQAPRYPRPRPPQRRRPPVRRTPAKRRATVTVQSGSNAFHWTMVLCTGGLWLLVWPLFRRKVRVTTKYRYR